MEIELSNINYKNKLIDINCKFKSSTITSIIGSSGAGKSLMGYVIMGIVKEYSGSLVVDGKSNYDESEFLRNVSYVMQRPNEHFVCDKVYDEIAFGLKQYKYKLDKIDTQIHKALCMVGLDDSYLQRELTSLSSGEIFKVAIASALVLNPKVLILDEVTTYLDANGKRDLVKLLKMLKERYKRNIIVISNDIDFVYAVSDNYILMNKGKIISQGEIEKLLVNKKILNSCGMETSMIDDFVSFVKEYKNIDLKGVRSIDDLVEVVVSRE